MASALRLLPFAALAAAIAGCATYHAQPLAPEQTGAAFDARSLSDPGLAAFLRDNRVAFNPSAPRWDADALTFAAFYFQPALAEERAQLEAARAAEKTARQWQNPSLAATGAYDRQIPGNPTPWSLVPLTVTFPVETAGKRRYRREAARHQAEAERWNLEGVCWDVRSKVRQALLNLQIARLRQRLLQAQDAAQARVVNRLQGQLAAGNVAGFEVTQARIALAATRFAEQDGLTQEADALTALAAAIGVPRRALEPVAFAFPDPAAAPSRPDARRFRQAALQGRSDVRAALAQYAAAQSALQEEIANQYPNLQLGPGYQFNSGSAGDNMWQLTLGLDLPVFNQNQGPIAEARAKRAAAAAHFVAVQAAAINEIDGAIARYDVALKEYATAEALTAELERRQQSIRALARAGEAEPLETDAAEVEYYNGALERLDALSRARQAQGELEDAVQSPL